MNTQKENRPLPQGVSVRNAFQAGDIGHIVWLHGVLYTKEYGWDHTFEAYVAGPLSEFAKSQTGRERIWLVERNNSIVGTVAIVEVSEVVAQLRWLLVHPDLRGLGLGRYLVEEALKFCRDRGYRSVFLWTEGRLTAAARIYTSLGFKQNEAKTHSLWGTVVTEERYELNL